MTGIKPPPRPKVRIESLAGNVRKPYRAPRLEKFGNISKLTAGVGGSNFDPGHNSQTKMGSCL